jgi:transcriptional regulator with XRE-family HTH domain
MTPEQLKQRRRALGMTQRQIADALGVDRQTVSRWEVGSHGFPGRMVDLAMQTIERDPKRFQAP